MRHNVSNYAVDRHGRSSDTHEQGVARSEVTLPAVALSPPLRDSVDDPPSNNSMCTSVGQLDRGISKSKNIAEESSAPGPLQQQSATDSHIPDKQ
ncbi:hypothetical protein TKK_0015672 [Trichogramma kaykai]